MKDPAVSSFPQPNQPTTQFFLVRSIGDQGETPVFREFRAGAAGNCLFRRCRMFKTGKDDGQESSVLQVGNC